MKGDRMTIEIAPPIITAGQNNYNPDGWLSCDVALLSTDASRDVTGCLAPITYKQGAILIKTIINIGNFNIVLKFNSASSAQVNKMFPPGGADLTLTPTQAALLYYDKFTRFVGDPLAGGWRVFAL
jgi:hypothetical protein